LPPASASSRCSTRYERQARAGGFARIAGLDEAGRGCLFGPVSAAAVILNPDRPIRGLEDSKQLTASERERAYERILAKCVAWASAEASATEIDRLNIYQAARLAMRRALEKLVPPPDFLLVDALMVESALPQRALIHGDALSRSIAAASIVAKVERDRSMADWDARYPEYGFLRHKGYGTPEHLKALETFGPTPDHRMSYEPVRIAAGLQPKQGEFFGEAAWV
jgi:ribonuclease HII